jgi:hypothetical protein
MPKISALPAAASVNLTDILPEVSPAVGGTTYQATFQQVLTAFQGAGTALTRTNDTNVTLTLGGSPTTALLNATSITAGWSGQLAVSRGGTGQSSYTNGQLLIGNTTGNTLVVGTITAGAGISVTNGAGTITIATSGGGLTVNNVTGTSSTMTVESINIANNAGLVTLTLPATAAIGDVIQVRGSGAGGWTIAQNASQIIHVGNLASTAGAGGSVASTNRYDAINLTCIVTNLEFVSSGVQSSGLTIV